jgi:hypothetical protein
VVVRPVAGSGSNGKESGNEIAPKSTAKGPIGTKTHHETAVAIARRRLSPPTGRVVRNAGLSISAKSK